MTMRVFSAADTFETMCPVAQSREDERDAPSSIDDYVRDKNMDG